MRFKTSLKKTSFIFVTAEIFFFSLVIFSLVLAAPSQDSHFNSKQLLTSSSLPTRLIIPAIKANATVEHMGVTSQGEMLTPKKSTDVAWFNLGPLPGQKGSAVISGHYGWENNTPAVFDNLSKLRKGDKVYVVNDSGLTTAFVVYELKIFKQSDDVSSVFNSADGKAHLNLITCTGDWDKIKKSYPDRLVVFTQKVE